MNASGLFRPALMTLALTCAFNAHAAPVGYQAPTTDLRDDVTYTLNIDGSYSSDEVEVVRINNQQGVTEASEYSYQINSDYGDVQILEAYTTTPDGKRIDVSPDRILLHQNEHSQIAATFADHKVRVVLFPALEVGSTITIHTNKIQKKPFFPNQIFHWAYFSRLEDTRAAQVVLRAPDALKLTVEAIGMDGGEVASDQPGTKMWRWHIENARAQAPEANTPDSIDFSPRLAFSTFADYPAFAAIYLARVRKQARVTPEIQALADQTTRGITDKRAQAEALYRWVSKNIRYIDVSPEFSGWMPHVASDIARWQYGDSQDQVTLLSALLAARGILCAPALVNSGNRFWLPRATSPQAFNHVISYLPDFKLFADPASGVAPFGEIAMRGKPVLVTDNGSGQAERVQLPLMHSTSDRIEVDTRLTLDPDGDLRGESQMNDSGAWQLAERRMISRLPKAIEHTFADKKLADSGQTGSGNYIFSNPRDPAPTFGYRAQFTLPDYANLPGPGALAIPRGLGLSDSIAEVFNMASDEQRIFPSVFRNGHRREISRLTLPPGLKVTALPGGIKLDTPFGHYESSYVLNGSTLTVTRTLDLDWPSATLSAQDYPAFRAMGMAVVRDSKAQILYE